MNKLQKASVKPVEAQQKRMRKGAPKVDEVSLPVVQIEADHSKASSMNSLLQKQESTSFSEKERGSPCLKPKNESADESLVGEQRKLSGSQLDNSMLGFQLLDSKVISQRDSFVYSKGVDKGID